MIDVMEESGESPDPERTSPSWVKWAKKNIVPCLALIIAIASAGFAKWSIDIAREANVISHESSILTHRPWISVDVTSSELRREGTIQFTLYNSGGSPAFNVRTHASWAYGKAEKKEWTEELLPLIELKSDSLVSTAIFPGESAITTGIDYVRALTRADQTIQPYVIYAVKYEGPHDESYLTVKCMSAHLSHITADSISVVDIGLINEWCSAK